MFRAICCAMLVTAASSRRISHGIRDSQALAEDTDLDYLESANESETLFMGDAAEACGAPRKKDLAALEKRCDDGRDSLKVITARVGQSPKNWYRLPPNRLYVCNPGSKVRGVLIREGQSPRKIQSSKELADVADKLFSGRLFPKFHFEKHDKKGEPVKRLYLWVLDVNGNFIVYPETQHGKKYKHGDGTPGNRPWSRPTKSSKKTSDGEQYRNGRYRGLARAGGEIEFNEGEPVVIQTQSSYVAFRVRPDTISRDSSKPIQDRVKAAKKAPMLGTCAMKRLKNYLKGPIAMSLDKTKVAAIYYKSWRERIYKYV